eukprot:g11146.t1
MDGWCMNNAMRTVRRNLTTPSLAAAFLYIVRGGTAQFNSCNGTVANIGDGRCDPALNTPYCGWDGGDCCHCTCSDGPVHACSDNVFDCLYPGCGDPASAITEDSSCVGDWIGDGLCDDVNNFEACDYDGGDVRRRSMLRPPRSCFDPILVAEFPDCTGDWFLIGDGSCHAENNLAVCGWDGGDRTWLVETAAQARALVGAVNCSGGSFEVEWRGHITVDEPIYVVGGTVLSLTGAEPGAVIDGNGSTRLFTVVNATLHVSGINITSGASVVGGGIAAFRGALTLNRTNLTGNRAALEGGGVYMSDGSSLSCADVSFVDNNAGMDGGAVYVTGHSLVSCGGSWLNNAAARDGGAVSVSDRSTVLWGEDAIFAHNTAGIDGGAIFSINASLSWSGATTFANNTAGVNGGATAIFTGSSASWNATTSFDSNSCGGSGGGVLVFDRSAVAWSASTTFIRNEAAFSGAVHVADNSDVSWTGDAKSEASFDGNVAIGDPDEFESGFGGALVLELSSSVSWHRDLDFSSNSAESVAGALYASQSTIHWSGNTTRFAENTAGLSGGALFIWNGSLVDWEGDTTFASNEAGTDGGAVASPGFDSAYNFVSSTLVVNGSTAFVNNTSGANGGALAVSDGLSVSISALNVSFMENAAEVAGGAIYVSGTGIGPVFTGVGFFSNTAQVGGAVSTVGSGNLKGFADVESPNPTMYERCRFIGNRATATGGAIESASGQDSIFNCVFEGNKALAGGALRLAGTASVENCTFADNASDDGGGAAVSTIGSISRMANISFRGNVFYCQPNMFLGFESGDPFEAVCSGCQTLCDRCFFDEPELVPSCQDVMDHSTSSGGTATLDTISIEPGYWRATASSTDILECYHADACLGGVSGSADYCLEGYEGPYCSVCSGGYTAQLGYTCDKCSGSAGGIVVVVVLAVAAVFLGVAFVTYVMSGEVGRMGRRGSFGRLVRSIPLQSLKIIIVAWQILTQFTAVANVTFPHVYQRFLNTLDVFNFDLTWILSAGCVVDVDFHDRLLVSTITPLVALVFMAGTYTAATTIYRGAPDTLQTIWNKHVSLVLLLTFLVYSSVSAAIFQTFACEPLADGNIYLRADYSIQCDSPKHQAFMVYGGVMMVLYTVGIPAFYGYLLFRDRDVLTKDVVDRESVPRITTTSDLWKPYKPSAFYYEVIECGRRILLAGVAVFIEPNTSAQIAVTLMIAFVFVVTSEALAPYASRWDAWLSRMGHAVVFVSMYVALLLKVDVSDERVESQRVFEVVLVGAHACMIVMVVVETVVLTCSVKADHQTGGEDDAGDD